MGAEPTLFRAAGVLAT
ncbi:putative membrane protein, partial [Yersinia pestis PY-64]